MPPLKKKKLASLGRVFRVAGRSLVVKAMDAWSRDVITEFFSGWYLDSEATDLESPGPEIVIRRTACIPPVPLDWPSFEIAGGGSCRSEGPTSYLEVEGSLVAVDPPGLAAVEVWIQERVAMPSPALTRVVTYALAAALRRSRLFELHSAALVDPAQGQGVLIIGPSGSGKSTLAVHLAAAGWPFLTDDVLLLRSEGSRVSAWPLRRCFAVTADTWYSSPLLQQRTPLDYTGTLPTDKKLFAPHRVFLSAFREFCIPERLFFTEVTGGEDTHFQPLSPAEAMARLIRMSPWSCYDRGSAAEHLATLSGLIRQSRAYGLLAGKDMLNSETAAARITAFLRP
jgi:hypothetical protein